MGNANILWMMQGQKKRMSGRQEASLDAIAKIHAQGDNCPNMSSHFSRNYGERLVYLEDPSLITFNCQPGPVTVKLGA